MKSTIYISLFLLSGLYAGLIQPAHQDSLYSIHSLFEWEQEPDAISYNLQVSSSENFEDIIIDINISDLMYIEKNNLEWTSDYYWRVRPIYLNGELGSWIDSFSFHTGFTK